MEISSIFKIIYIDEYLKLAKEGLKILFIFSKEVMDRLKVEFQNIYNDYKNIKNVTFFVSDSIKIASCTITNNFISFSLFTKKGYYINHEMISYNSSSIQWG